MLIKIDHIAIAVRSLDAALETFSQLLSGSTTHITIEQLPAHHVRIAFLTLGETRIEFLEPLSAESPVAKFLDKYGEGVHHLAFESSDIHSDLNAAAQKNFQPLSMPTCGAEHSLVSFLHPKGLHGVLVELVQRTAVST
ncbi:MAG: methylmalonyl-CoA epimerase, partial [Candidatus Thermochlorobacter sp.]